MGMYLNPGNINFAEDRSEHYVDKSGLIGLVNRTINTPERLSCVSRPRRFGKSYAAKMLCAYYDKSCDSSSLFENLQIARDDTYLKHMNQYDVIYLDMTSIIQQNRKGIPVGDFVESLLTDEILETYHELAGGSTFLKTLERAAQFTGNKFIVIIDEWDAPVRDRRATADSQWEYLEFLRTLFKNSGVTNKIFAAVYMTGILPIKKDGSQSAISEFKEYTFLEPGAYAPYVGFTEGEVLSLCEENDIDFSAMKKWYDGYSFGKGSVYNPNSVMEAIRNRAFRSYWSKSSSASGLLDYINMDFDGLGQAVEDFMIGREVGVNVRNFQNDLNSFRSKDDVLTLLVHFGYLCFDAENNTVRIPNEEIRLEFADLLRSVTHADIMRCIRESDRLIEDTIGMREEAVAAQIEKVHREECTPVFYNDEQALRSVVKKAYLTYKDYFIRFEELPGGNGYADVVFLPKKGIQVPALVVELKWNKTAEGAISQIKERNYPEAIADYGAPVLLVGINYDRESKRHSCRIEEWRCQSS